MADLGADEGVTPPTTYAENVCPGGGVGCLALMNTDQHGAWYVDPAVVTIDPSTNSFHVALSCGGVSPEFQFGAPIALTAKGLDKSNMIYAIDAIGIGSTQSGALVSGAPGS